MQDVLAGIILCLSTIAFLYFGYRSDYRRDPKTFWKTIMGVLLLGFSTAMGWFGATAFFKKWRKKP